MASKGTSKWTWVLDGDATGANRALGSVGKHAGGLGSKIAKVGGLIAAAFSVTKIIQFGKESVHAMMEDQKAAAILARTLKNVTHARQSEIDGIEQYIRKLEETVGVEDDKLRPAYSRLIRSTKNMAKSQTLLNLSLDISAATGKDLGTVANAVSKAYDGNFASLTRLGLSLDKSLIKSKDFSKVQAYLTKTFQGSAQTAANSFAGRIDRLQLAFQNMKEDVGYALLPSLEKMASWMTDTGVPAIQTFIATLTGNGIKSARSDAARVADSWSEISPLEASAANLAQAIRNLTDALGELFGTFTKGTDTSSGMVVFLDVLTRITVMTERLVRSLSGFKKSASGFLEFTSKALGWLSILTGADPQGGVKVLKSPTPKNGRAIGGTINAGSATLVGERGPEVFTATTNGRIWTANQIGGGGQPINVNVHVAGSVIRERDLATSVRDQIAQLMRRRGADPSILGV